VSALVLCTSTRHTGVSTPRTCIFPNSRHTGVLFLAHAFSQTPDTQEFYSSHMYICVCISLLCTHSFFRDVYSCLSLRWATKHLGHPLKARGQDWIQRNPSDRLARDLTSAQAQEQATPPPPDHFARAIHMAQCLGVHMPNIGSPHQPSHPPAFGFPASGIVVPPRPIFGRACTPQNNSIVALNSGAAAASQLGSFQQGIMLGSLMHQQDALQTENQQLRGQLAAARGLEHRFPI
jgi:hypothetical protein